MCRLIADSGTWSAPTGTYRIRGAPSYGSCPSHLPLAYRFHPATRPTHPPLPRPTAVCLGTHPRRMVNMIISNMDRALRSLPPLCDLLTRNNWILQLAIFIDKQGVAVPVVQHVFPYGSILRMVLQQGKGWTSANWFQESEKWETSPTPATSAGCLYFSLCKKYLCFGELQHVVRLAITGNIMFVMTLYTHAHMLELSFLTDNNGRVRAFTILHVFSTREQDKVYRIWHN